LPQRNESAKMVMEQLRQAPITENDMNNAPNNSPRQADPLEADRPVEPTATQPASSLPACLGRNGALHRQRFQELARQWKDATLFLSSITDIAMHPAYQQIIGMGKDALPLLLDELRRHPDHWFWALQAITGVNPVPVSDRGDMGRMTQAWLAWADQQGL
jgi:hypothetical protein